MSTVLKVARTPAASRAARTSASGTDQSHASWASEKPSRLARRHARRSIAGEAELGEGGALLDDGEDLVEEPGVDLGALGEHSTEMPRRSAASSWKGRSGVPMAARLQQLLVVEVVEHRLGRDRTPGRGGRARGSASPSAAHSGNVRPIAIASPTDCIDVPSTPGVPGNFSNAQRGTLVTT